MNCPHSTGCDPKAGECHAACMRTTSEGTTSAQRILREVPIAGRRCIDTGRVVIGRCHIQPPPRELGKEAERIQTALLDERTTQVAALWRRALAPLWRLC